MGAPDQVSISKAEWAVMEVIWIADRPLTSEEIIESLALETSWSEGTIRSLLNRLAKKKAVETKREGRRFFYRPSREKSECLKQESTAFLDQYFGGQLTPMMACFLGEQIIDDAELDRLEKLIQEKRKQSE